MGQDGGRAAAEGQDRPFAEAARYGGGRAAEGQDGGKVGRLESGAEVGLVRLRFAGLGVLFFGAVTS